MVKPSLQVWTHCLDGEEVTLEICKPDFLKTKILINCDVKFSRSSGHVVIALSRDFRIYGEIGGHCSMDSHPCLVTKVFFEDN